MLRTKQANIFCREAAAAFGERNVMVVVQIVGSTALHAFAAVALPDLDFDVRRDQASVRQSAPCKSAATTEQRRARRQPARLRQGFGGQGRSPYNSPRFCVFV